MVRSRTWGEGQASQALRLTRRGLDRLRQQAESDPTRQRLDRWMFFARASKSRTLAQKLIESGAVRINSERTRSPHRLVGPGDVLTMTLGRRLLVWRVVGAACMK